jgi:hypothetical protein
MANTIYITAGIQVAKDSGQSPDSGVNTFYITAGLPPEVESGAAVIEGDIDQTLPQWSA